MAMEYMTYEYKGFYIDRNFYGKDEVTVQYCGDDMVFDSIEEAEKAIDEIIAWENLKHREE